MKKCIFALHVILAVLAAFTVFSAAAPAQAAAKETVYVLTEIRYDAKTSIPVYVYKYYKNGLLKSYTLGKGASQGEYKYNKKQQLVKFRRSLNEWCNFDYTYNKKGQIIKIKNYYTNKNNNKFAYDGYVSKLTYDKKGRMIKQVDTGKTAVYSEEGEPQGEKKGSYTTTYSYNKKGQMIRSLFTSTFDKKLKSTANYKYDSKGNLKSISYSDGYKQVRTITYDKAGNITSISGGDSVTVFYTWKKMSVNKKLAAQIKAQQWSLTNQNLNFAIPTNDHGM